MFALAHKEKETYFFGENNEFSLCLKGSSTWRENIRKALDILQSCPTGMALMQECTKGFYPSDFTHKIIFSLQEDPQEKAFGHIALKPLEKNFGNIIISSRKDLEPFSLAIIIAHEIRHGMQGYKSDFMLSPAINYLIYAGAREKDAQIYENRVIFELMPDYKTDFLAFCYTTNRDEKTFDIFSAAYHQAEGNITAKRVAAMEALSAKLFPAIQIEHLFTEIFADEELQSERNKIVFFFDELCSERSKNLKSKLNNILQQSVDSSFHLEVKDNKDIFPSYNKSMKGSDLIDCCGIYKKDFNKYLDKLFFDLQEKEIKTYLSREINSRQNF